jgi:signal transduction histidine kinase
MSSKVGLRAGEAGSRPSAGGGPRPAGGVVHTLLGAPFTRRAWQELLYAVVGVPLGVAGFVLTVAFLGAATVLTISLVGTVLGLVLLMTGLRVARVVSAAQRALAGALLGLPTALAKFIAVLWWAYGVFSVTSPVWWLLFRNHPAGTHLSPVHFGRLAVETWPGTWLAAVAGAAILLVAPWLVHGIVVSELWLLARILGPGEMAARVATLERSRSEVVNEAAALVRQIERNLHDGAQTRLATLALHLGMARDKLAAGGPDEVAAARDLVDAAHAEAKEALVELRDLSSGIHPPVLDNGLGPALENLAAGSAIPVRMTAHLTERPSPAIETIAYFSAAELLANAVKHSSANMIEVAATSPPGGPFVLTVSDDGRGGADEADGSGLSGLRHRARTVDGTLAVTSPPGGPTTVIVELPLHP